MKMIFLSCLALFISACHPKTLPAILPPTTEAKSNTQVIRTVAQQIAVEAPVQASKTQTIHDATLVIDTSVDTLVEQNVALQSDLATEREGNRRLFGKLLAWTSVAAGVGLAFSIALALWFRTRTALFAAGGFAGLMLVTAALTVLLDYMLWILLAVGVLCVALIAWLVYDDRQDRLKETPNDTQQPKP